MGARGFGQLRAQIDIEELDPADQNEQLTDDIHAIRQRVCLPMQWREVPIKLAAASTFADDVNFNGQVLNCVTVTVKTGTIYVWHRQNTNVNLTPDYIWSASDTKQLALSPRAWDTWSFMASGGAAEAMLIFGNV